MTNAHIQVHEIWGEYLQAAKGQQLTNQRGGPLGGVLDLYDPAQVHIRRRHGLGDQIAVADHNAHDVVEVVGDPARQAANRLHFLRLQKLRFQLLALGIIDQKSMPKDAAIRLPFRRGIYFDPEQSPFRVLHTKLVVPGRQRAERIRNGRLKVGEIVGMNGRQHRAGVINYIVGSESKNIVQPGTGEGYGAGAVRPHEKRKNSSWNAGHDPSQFLLDGFRLFAFGDVFDRAFVTYDFPGSVHYGTHVRRYPFLLAISVIDFEIEIVQFAAIFQQTRQFLVRAGIDK